MPETQEKLLDAPLERANPRGAFGRLTEQELFWRDHYDWLLERGYELRPRYKPDWQPSWKGKKKRWYHCTDSLRPFHNSVLDATRTSDGELVVLKRTNKSLFPHEADIALYLSSGPIAADPHNHCVPVYEILQVPEDDDLLLLVMPLLRVHDDPRFDTIGECVEFFRQVFEGLQFMHQHNIAHRQVAMLFLVVFCSWVHRDVTFFNIMMDARQLYVDRYHPFLPWRKLDLSGSAKHRTRTRTPVKYYLTDFGLSRQYKPEERPPLEEVIRGADKTAPEYSTMLACDPFPTDVYLLGNMIRENFTKGSQYASARRGFEFIVPLVTDMTQTDPAQRPTMDEVVQRFDVICQELSTWKLRSRVVKTKDSAIASVFRSIGHWNRRIRFMVQGVPPIPQPKA
ncbi:hypothetical protein ONZ45_g8608 [Pleurotus djamor]|nr:hypothetical protein ONZ45_g8608 [Pleurotus djamor]